MASGGCSTLHRTHQGRPELQAAHRLCDGQGRPVRLLLTAGQTSDHVGAAILLADLPQARELVADRGYDSTQYRDALTERGMRLEDWRRIAARYDRCAHTFQSATCIAVVVAFWLT